MWSIRVFLGQTAELGLMNNMNFVGKEEGQYLLESKTAWTSQEYLFPLEMFKELCCGRKYEKKFH